MKKILLTSIFLLLQNIVIPQELGSPIIVSPLIGDKLDRIENEYFDKIFPSFEGFVEAEFYLNTDSSLTAKIIYEQDNVIKDSIIDNFYNLTVLRRYLLNRVRTYSPNAEEFRIVFADDTENSVNLFSVTENEVNAFNSEKKELSTFRNEEIKKIVKKEAVANTSYNVAGLLIGIPIGILGGYLLVGDDEQSGGSMGPNLPSTDQIAGFIFGALIGAGIGYIIGTAIDNSVTVDKEFTANPEGCFCHLEEYTILSLSLRLK